MKLDDFLRDYIKLNDVRKMFLLAWIPIVVLVIAALTMEIGQLRVDPEILTSQVFRRVEFRDILPAYITVLLLSLALYIMVGLPFDKLENRR